MSNGKNKKKWLNRYWCSPGLPVKNMTSIQEEIFRIEVKTDQKTQTQQMYC